MRKKMLLLVLSLAVTAGALGVAPVQANNAYYCPQCTTDPDGTRCCTDCWCENAGQFVITTCTAMAVCEFAW
ncbi:MAG TPA: hypothetical protein VIW92_17060 [Thermoanaerobaculia bacterium]